MSPFQKLYKFMESKFPGYMLYLHGPSSRAQLWLCINHLLHEDAATALVAMVKRLKRKPRNFYMIRYKCYSFFVITTVKVPRIRNLDTKILARVKSIHQLDMENWHTCKTTHCRGGWAIVLAGKAGKQLEQQLGSEMAAALIYAVSKPRSPLPDFFESEVQALLDIAKGVRAERLAAKKKRAA